ncbi:MAG: hypothetical protein SCALA702_06370 [Melioribacteraceae bacterium]|nr:MAG: hypothetical protein SCALA702_06370 [Melioribacteraceae bacterium]
MSKYNCFDFGTDQTETQLYGWKLFEKLPSKQLIVLRSSGDEKHNLNFELTDQIREMDRHLNEYNELVACSDIKAPLTSILGKEEKRRLRAYRADGAITKKNFWEDARINLDCRVYRVFNDGSFDKGGRFYGAEYQKFDEREREPIEINNSPTVEIDFAGLHINMLYNIQGLPTVEDPYAVFEDSPLRKLFKKALLIILNADSRRGAVAAFNKGLKSDSEALSLLKAHNISAKKIFGLIDAYFSSISHYFYSGIGLELMNKDSIIAEAVLKYFTEKGIPCLCVHDSFIVEKQYSDKLKEVMSDAYYNQFKFIPYLK